MDIIFGVISAADRAENIARQERGTSSLTSLAFIALPLMGN
jgi:hypothetical protein